MTDEFIIVRHSERLDEVDEIGWKRSLRNNSSLRCKYSLQNDPPITQNGVALAADAGRTIKELIQYIKEKRHPETKVRIYSSKLLRCVQTAYQIALEVNEPVHLAAGLAYTAIALSRLRDKSKFEFLSINEMKRHCPDVEFVCCDHPTSALHVSTSSWDSAISSIVKRNEINIIVAHRETIRNLIGERFKLPYCSIGIFRLDQKEDRPSVQPVRIMDKDGKILEDYTLPVPDITTVGGVNQESISYAIDEAID